MQDWGLFWSTVKQYKVKNSYWPYLRIIGYCYQQQFDYDTLRSIDFYLVSSESFDWQLDKLDNSIPKKIKNLKLHGV